MDLLQAQETWLLLWESHNGTSENILIETLIGRKWGPTSGDSCCNLYEVRCGQIACRRLIATLEPHIAIGAWASQRSPLGGQHVRLGIDNACIRPDVHHHVYNVHMLSRGKFILWHTEGLLMARPERYFCLSRCRAIIGV